MECQVRIEFDRTGLEGDNRKLRGFIVPHLLPYMPRVGEFSFDPSGLMKDSEQRERYQDMEERFGSTCVSHCIISFENDVQKIILVLAFELDYGQTLHH